MVRTAKLAIVKITRVHVWQLDLPLHKPYWLSGGRLKFERLDSTILRIDTAVAHFAQSIPASSCLGSWCCQEMISVDPAPGQGARNLDGCFITPDLPGLGVEPDLELLGKPIAVY